MFLSLLVDAGVPSLDLQRDGLLITYWYRLQRQPNNPAYTVAIDTTVDIQYRNKPLLPRPFRLRVRNVIGDLSLPNFPIAVYQVPPIAPWEFPNTHFCRYFNFTKESISTSTARQLFLSHTASHATSVPVYTDGSKSDAGVGFGAVFPDFSRSGTLPAIASIFTAELSALLLAIRTIFTLRVDTLTVYCDSQAALSTIEDFRRTHPIVLDIFSWLVLTKRRGHQVTFCWVPAHVSVRGNEKADEVARAAASRPPSQCALPHKELHPTVRSALRGVWQRRWAAVAATMKMGEVTTRAVRPWSYSHIKSRKKETVLARLKKRWVILDTHMASSCPGEFSPTVTTVWSP